MDQSRLTPIGRALKELGIQKTAAYSPHTRGRSERSFRTWQGRPRQELRLAGITTPAEDNRLPREQDVAEFKHRFVVPPTERGTAFWPCARRDLHWVFTVQTEQVVTNNSSVAIPDRWWQVDKFLWRFSLAGAMVKIHKHLNPIVSIRYGPHVVGCLDPAGQPLGRLAAERPWKRRGRARRGQPRCGFPSLAPSLGNRRWRVRRFPLPYRHKPSSTSFTKTVGDKESR